MGLPDEPLAQTMYSAEYQVGVCRQHNRVCSTACRAVGMSRGVVIGVNNCLYERTLAIGCDVGIACRNCDRSRCRRLPAPMPAVKRHRPTTKPSYAVVVVRPAESIRGKIAASSLERAIRRWRLRRAPRGKARRSA